MQQVMRSSRATKRFIGLYRTKKDYRELQRTTDDTTDLKVTYQIKINIHNKEKSLFNVFVTFIFIKTFLCRNEHCICILLNI